MGSIRKNDKIILTYYVNPHHFYFKYKEDAYGDEQLSAVNQEIEKYVSRHIENRRSNPYSPEIGEIVLCHYISDCVYNWIRARVDFKLQYDKEMFVLWAIDYGFPIESEPRMIRPIHSDDLQVPIKGLIFKGGLFDVVPSTMEFNFIKSVEEPRKMKKWSARAVERVEKYLHQADSLTFKCRAFFEDHYFGSLIISSQLILEDFLKSSNEAVDSDNFLSEFSQLEDQPYWQRQSQDAIYKIYENNSELSASNDVTTTWTPTDDLLNKTEFHTGLPKFLELNDPNTTTTDEALIKLSHQFDDSTKFLQSDRSSSYSFATSRVSTSATNDTFKPKLPDTKDVTISEIPMKSRLAVAQQKIIEQGFIVDNQALEDKQKYSGDTVTMSVNLTKKKNNSHFDRAKEMEECFSVSEANRILVHNRGNIECERINDIHDVEFPQQIHDALKHLNIQQVFRIQTIGWPGLMSGSSMIFVNNARTGKTWTYLPAICALIIQRVQDNKVVNGCGPLAIIACASSQEVNEITDRIAHLLRFAPGIRCFKASRFSDQGTVWSQLLNGAEVLVTTVPCLNRLMVNELRLFTKGRIISLVFDNIDLVFERFGRQILKIHKALCAPTSNVQVQVIVTSRTWHKVLANFYEETTGVTLCIGSYIEAAVYGRTDMTIELLGQRHKIDKLIAHINDINYRSELTVVICNTSADVEDLVQKLQSMSIEIWCYHDKSDSFEIGAIKKQIVNCKSGHFKLFICTDEVLHDINIRCANHIVHFSLPSTWTLFGFRFSTLFDRHRNWTERKSGQKGTTSVVFLDEKNNNELPRLVDFMQMRANCNIPEQLIKAAESIRMENVSNVYQPFCNDLATIGICYSQFTCRERHIFTKFDWSNEIPAKGFVKFEVVTVRSPVHYTVRLLEHRPSSKDDWTRLHSSDEFFRFNMEMAKHFEDENNQTMHHPIVLGDLCAVRVQSMGEKFYERGKIVKIEEQKYMTVRTAYLVEILLIDHNERMSCSSTALVALPDKFKRFPCQVIDVRIADIVPRDFENEWDASIVNLVKKWITNENQHYCQGFVKLAAMNTLWVESVELIEVLPSINEKVKLASIKKNLLDRNFCVLDTKPLEILTTLAKNADLLRAQDVDTKQKEIVDRTATTEVSVFNKSDDDNFDLDESNPSLLNWTTSSDDDDAAVPFRENLSNSVASSDAHEGDLLRLSEDKWAELTLNQADKVFLCNFYHPNRIYIRNSFYTPKFMELIQRINEFVGLPENLIQLSKVALAENCLAKFGNSGFSRVKIMKLFHDADGITAEVFYVDYGEFLVLPVEELIEIPEHLVGDVPFQAIFCRLISVRPIDSPQWCDTICDTIYDDLLVKQQHFYVRSIQLADPDKYAPGLKTRSYQVVLFDETGHVNVNDWIVSNRYGESDPDTKHFANVDIDGNAIVPLNNENENESGEAENSNEYFIDFDDDDNFDFQFEDNEIFKMLQANGFPLPELKEPRPAKIEEIQKNEKTKAVLDKPVAEINPPPVKTLSLIDSGKRDHGFTELTSQFKIPKIKWHQSESIVVVAVHAPDVVDYNLCVTPRMLKICFTKNQEKYCALLNLFGCIEAKYTVHDIRGLNIVIRLVKTLNRLTWPRLIQAKEKDSFIEYNFEADKYEESQFETPSPAAFYQHHESYSSEEDCEEDNEIDPDEEIFARRFATEY